MIHDASITSLLIIYRVVALIFCTLCLVQTTKRLQLAAVFIFSLLAKHSLICSDLPASLLGVCYKCAFDFTLFLFMFVAVAIFRQHLINHR